MTLRLHLILLVVVCMLPAIALLAMDQVQLRRAREAEVRGEILGLAKAGAGEIDRVIDGGKQLLTALEQAPAIRERNAPLCSALLGRLQQDYPIYASIVATDPSGRGFCTSRPGQAIYEADQAWFHAALQTGGFVVGGYAVSPGTDAAVLPMAQPITAADGRVLGVLVVSLDLGQLGRDLAAKLPPGTALTLADRNGTVLLHVGDGARGEDIGAGSNPPPGMPASILANGAATADVTGPAGIARIVAAVPAGDNGLRVLVARRKPDAFAALDATTWNGIVLIVAGLTVALLIAALIAWRFIQLPVRELLQTAERLRQGEYGRRARPTGSRSELGRLGQALNALAFALAERERDRDIAETQLLEFAGTLEHRVEERTQALAEANAQLAAEAEERQRAQATLAQAQKLDALGQLIGGVAHDFNNLLAAILGSLEIALKRVEEARVHRLLSIAMRAAERGAKLTAHMLAFSRKQELVLRPVNVNEVIGGTSDMLGRTIGPMIRVHHDLAADLWPAVADPVRIEVALLNLALNARDAMPEGGALTFRTRNVVAARPGSGQTALPQGDYVMVTVSDTGEGMPAEVHARAFEPFFTTKGAGKGTGLGLSMVYGFAIQAGGTVTIDSIPGKGTAISLYLPRAAQEQGEATAVAEMVGAAQALRVLLVDDDADVRETTQEMLDDLGHAVTAAESGPAGLALLRDGQEFDLLLVDFAMPEMTGVQFAEQALALRRAPPVLLMTGYAESDVRQSWSERGYRMVMKPFSTAELAAALRPFTSAVRSAGEVD
ncbi:MAG TPA: ATP-binding protein [Acetobacteraceae bacterium]|jgi:signal transduction histidine kinase/ActR/RegA family two-component response regulator